MSGCGLSARKSQAGPDWKHSPQGCTATTYRGFRNGLPTVYRTSLHFAFQRERITAVTHCGITIFEVIMDVLDG